MVRRQFVSCFALALLGLAFNTAMVMAEDAKVLKGEIASIAEDGGSFVVKAGDDSVTVKVTDSTVYVLGGEESTKADTLKVGAKVKVTHVDAVASKVEAGK